MNVTTKGKQKTKIVSLAWYAGESHLEARVYGKQEQFEIADPKLEEKIYKFYRDNLHILDGDK